MKRPLPPDAALDDEPIFLPAPEIVDWLRSTFLTQGNATFNKDHIHLGWAKIGALWTNVPNKKGGLIVAGTAEMPSGGMGGAWQRGRVLYQLTEWFGEMPTFLLTFNAPIAVTLRDASWMGLVEHEMYHCGQARNAFGGLAWKKDGTPRFCMRAHDVSEFVPVVERYGSKAASANVDRLIAAGRKRPKIGRADVAAACGTCGLRAA